MATILADGRWRTTIYYINVGQCMHALNYHLCGSKRRIEQIAERKGEQVKRALLTYEHKGERSTAEYESQALVEYLQAKGMTSVGAHSV